MFFFKICHRQFFLNNCLDDTKIDAVSQHLNFSIIIIIIIATNEQMWM